jgi:hypothetical protein
MRSKPESFLSIWLESLCLIGLAAGVMLWYWMDHMYSAGMSVDFAKVVVFNLIAIAAIATVLSWVTWKITKGRS